MTMVIAVMMTDDPSIDLNVLQFAAMPVASAIASARFVAFTSFAARQLRVRCY
jgi:hypothetical protein